MNQYLLDSGFLYASIDQTDDHHKSVKNIASKIRGNIVLPVPAITEVAYFLAKIKGLRQSHNFWIAWQTQHSNLNRPHPKIINAPPKFSANITMQILILLTLASWRLPKD